MDNKKLAQLIYSVAQYEGYNTSVLQTQKNLATHKDEWIFSTESDRYIFEDLLKAIQYASTQKELTVEVVKGINAQMNSKMSGQPESPGELRQNVPIHVGDYVPAETVTETMLQRQLEAVTGNTIQAGWELYARLSKLQPFDDGNKRTALISANLLVGSLTDNSKEYLVIPMDFRKTKFDASLVYYYMADDWDDHMPDEQDSLSDFVKFSATFTLENQ
jgi:hypothetical protein